MNVPDYKRIDYRGFVFAVHEAHGLLLLHCTRKPKKGPHYQLPGGHVDNFEFEGTVKKNADATKEQILLEACKLGAARELYEETGIDIRRSLDRLEPASLTKVNSKNELECMLKNKCYFHLQLTDKDFFSSQTSDRSNLMATNDANGPKDLLLKISEEHSGFIFEPDPFESIKKLKVHSGGSGSMALQMSMQNYAVTLPNPNAPGEDWEIQVDLNQKYEDNYEDLAPRPERQSIWNCFC